ncbi:hypothetical protein BG004_007273 [Podila humilis]|nr:hypothetical protein BG004_007273 [Podila humilis]
MADLGMYFGDEDDEQLEQEDKALSYLVLNNDQDDSFDPVDTENLLAQMSGDSLMSHDIEMDESTDIVRLFADLSFTSAEKITMFAKSEHEFHRSFLAREIFTLLPQMRIHEAILTVIPVVKELAIDHGETVRETIASQLDKIVLYFLRNTRIDNTLSSIPLDEYAQYDSHDGDEHAHSEHNVLSELPRLPPGFFTSIFVSLLLEQNDTIAHNAKLAVISVAENVPESLLESEILNGVLAGLSDLYRGLDDAEGGAESSSQIVADQHEDEAVIGKAVVVVLLTSLARLLGQKRCVELVVPTLEKLLNTSPFYVQKEIVLALGELCMVVSRQFLVEKLLPLYESCAQNESWHVRRACCNVLAPFAAALPADLRATKIVEIFDLFSVDVSRSVRIATTEVLGQVIASYDEGNVPDSMLTHFLSMGQQPMNEHERASMCAFSFPAVVLTAGRSKWEDMKPTYMRLAGTFRSPIRRTLACSLHEIAKILGPELADRDLAIAFADCLKAENEVKEAVLGHVVEFVSCLSPNVRSRSLQDIHEAWIEMGSSSNWRLRDSLAGHLPALCETASADDLIQVLIPLSVLACTDSVSTIRESGVMSFPALWEASSRIGEISLPVKQGTPERQEGSVSDIDHEEEDEDKFIGGLRSFHQADDDELKDFQGKQSVMISFDQGDNDDGEHGCKSRSYAELPIKYTPNTPTLANGERKMTSIREHVIQQTVEFAVNGGFRSRVVAVQIIQSLLDHGITVTEFEDHFLPLLADTLAVDTVVNVRIWVARVVSWILESKYYGEDVVTPKLHTLLASLQLDPDRDVRIYSGGPAELPKPKKKKTSKKKKEKNKRAKAAKAAKVSVFHQNPKAGQVATIQEEDEEDDTQLLFDNGENLHSDNSEDENSDDDDDDDDSDEDDSSDEDTDYLDSAKAGGISNKPRNRNSFGIGMKVMVGDKLTVSGKEIRKPKTSWDYVQDQVENDDSEPKVIDFSGLDDQDQELGLLNFRDGEYIEDSSEPRSFDMPRSTLSVDDDEDEEVEEDSDCAKVIPYTTLSANGASPLDVEMEDEKENEASDDKDSSSSMNTSDSGFDGELSDVNVSEAGENDMDEDAPESQPSARAIAVPSLQSTQLMDEQQTLVSTGLVEADISHGFPPLSSGSNGMNAPSPVVAAAIPLSYAALIKNSASTMTSFSQINIPEPSPSDMATVASVTVAAATGQYTPTPLNSTSPASLGSLQKQPHQQEQRRTKEEAVLQVLSAKLSASSSGKKLTQMNSNGNTFHSSINTHTRPHNNHSVPPPLSLDRIKDLGRHIGAAGGPVGLLSPGVPPISYASVVASGAPASSSAPSTGSVTSSLRVGGASRPMMHSSFSSPMTTPQSFST